MYFDLKLLIIHPIDQSEKWLLVFPLTTCGGVLLKHNEINPSHFSSQYSNKPHNHNAFFSHIVDLFFLCSCVPDVSFLLLTTL